MNLKIKIDKEGCMPMRHSEEAAGFDLVAAETVVLKPGIPKVVPAGFRMEMPKGYEAQIRPRSGLAVNKSITVLNSPGTIDSDYRGPVGVIMINHGRSDETIVQKDRIAQMVINKLPEVEMEVVNELNETQRGEGGFGSTGS